MMMNACYRRSLFFFFVVFILSAPPINLGQNPGESRDLVIEVPDLTSPCGALHPFFRDRATASCPTEGCESVFHCTSLRCLYLFLSPPSSPPQHLNSSHASCSRTGTPAFPHEGLKMSGYYADVAILRKQQPVGCGPVVVATRYTR